MKWTKWDSSDGKSETVVPTSLQKPVSTTTSRVSLLHSMGGNVFWVGRDEGRRTLCNIALCYFLKILFYSNFNNFYASSVKGINFHFIAQPSVVQGRIIYLDPCRFYLGTKTCDLFIYDLFSQYLVSLYKTISYYPQTVLLVRVEKPEKQRFILHSTTLPRNPEWWNTFGLVTPCSRVGLSSQVLQNDSPEAVELNLPTASLVSSEIRETSLS